MQQHLRPLAHVEDQREQVAPLGFGPAQLEDELVQVLVPFSRILAPVPGAQLDKQQRIVHTRLDEGSTLPERVVLAEPVQVRHEPLGDARGGEGAERVHDAELLDAGGRAQTMPLGELLCWLCLGQAHRHDPLAPLLRVLGEEEDAARAQHHED